MSIDRFRIKPSSYTAMHGSFVASHCISDSLIFLSLGIGCKAQLPHYMGGHELDNNFVSRMGWAEMDGDDLIQGNTSKIHSNMLGQIDRNNARFFPVVISPVVKTIGMDSLVKQTAERLRESTGTEVRYVELSGAESDFWEGYNGIIRSYLETLDWSQPVERKTVNIFGYPFDRYEMEHGANIKELRKMLAKIGVKTQAIFLSGTSTQDLSRAVRAEYNIILPHASDMGGFLEKITKRESIYLEHPIGKTNTRRFLMAMSNKLKRGRRQLLEYIDEEEKTLAPILERTKEVFREKKIGLVLDIPYIGALSSFLKELDASISFIAIRDRHFGGRTMLDRILKAYSIGEEDILVLDSPSMREIISAVTDKNLDLVIGSGADIQHIRRKTDTRTMIFGFPSYGKHYTEKEAPFLGFGGMKNLSEELMECIREDDQV